MLLNGNCSWSYKSLKVINSHKTDNESNEYSPSLVQSSQVTLKNNINISSNKTSHNRVDNTGQYRPVNDSKKRKFFDVDDSSPEVKYSTAENSYDFEEFDKAKTIKKPRKRAVKKKSKKNGNTQETKPKKVISPRNKKKVDYTEWDSHSELEDNENHTKFLSEEQVSQTCLDKAKKHIKLQFDDKIGLLKNEQTKLQSDKVSRISINGTENTDDESNGSDDGFVFQTRFSDKNAKVIDITNSIESDSVEASPTSNGICDKTSLLNTNVANEKEQSEKMLDEDRILSIDCSPHEINEIKEPNGDLESENSTFSPPELLTDELDFENSNIETREPENESSNNEQFAISLQDHINEKCRKINEEIKEMYDKLERDIFQPDDKLETISFKKNAKLEEANKNFKFKRSEMNANDEKYKLAKEKDYIQANISKSGIDGRKSEKGSWFELEKENNTKHFKQSNDYKSPNVTNSSKTQYSNKGTDKIPFNAIQPTDHSNPEGSISKTKMQAPIFNLGTNEEFSSIDNYQMIERNEVNNSIRSSNSSEICSPKLKLKSSLMKSNDNLNTITKSLSGNDSSPETQSEIWNISKESQNDDNQWKSSIKGFSKEEINLKPNSKFRSKNNLKGKNTKSTKPNSNQSLTSPKFTITLQNIEKLAVSPKVSFSKVTSKENENKPSYKSLKAINNDVPKPKTWEDLETKLLTEIDNTENEALRMSPRDNNFFSSPKRISDEVGDKRHSDFWEEKRELKIGNFFEISQYKRSKRIVTSKKKKPLMKKHAANKPSSHISNQKSALESPSINIMNKAIAAMNRSTAEYFSRNEGDSFGSFSEKSNVDVQGTEYSYSILSATIQTSGKKLNLTEKRSKYIQNINDDVNRNNLGLKKNKSIEEDNTLNENIFSMTTRQAITSDCKATNRENVQGNKTSKKADNAKISITNKNNASSFNLKNNGYLQNGLDDENILTLENQDDSTEETSRMVNDSSDMKCYFEQRYGLRKRKSVKDKKNINNKKRNVSAVQESNAKCFHDSANESKASLKNYFSVKSHQKINRNEDSTSSQSEKYNVEQLKSNHTIKQISPKEKYIKYLKNLFQNETAQETKTNSGEIGNNEQNNTSQYKQEGTKFLMKEDDLFSISSDDFEKDETGYCSEASGLFCDVLDED